MLSVEEFRAKYPNSTEEQVAGYAAAVAAEMDIRRNSPKIASDAVTRVEPEKLELMPKIIRDPVPPTVTSYQMPRGFRSRRALYPTPIAPPSVDVEWNPKPVDRDASDNDASDASLSLAPEIRGLIRGGFGHLSAADRARAEQPGLSESDLLAIVAGLPTAADLEGADA